MRAFASFLAASALLAAPAEAAPRRVASLNLCTDELLLALASPGQIASVTHLSQDPGESPFWRHARAHPRNDGQLMNVVPLRPDLVLTMGGGARDQQRIARRLGIPFVDLPFAMSLDDFQRNLRQVAALLGQRERGEAWRRRLARLRAAMPVREHDTIWLGESGRSVSSLGLEAQWLALAGLSQRPLQSDRVSLETLLMRPPAVLVRSDYRQGQYSAGQRWLSHPLARRVRAGRTLVSDGRRWTCLGLSLIPEIERLRRRAQAR
ncbi:MAG: ABC transporter substrate-binding protein [Sphingosinicella sp.]